VLGIVTIAAGLKLSIGHAGSELPVGPATALAGGAALFLVGAAALRRAFRIGHIGARLVVCWLCRPSCSGPELPPLRSSSRLW
jgi:low temperature requirement protein LtrA